MSLSTEHLAQLTDAKALLASGELSEKIGGLFGVSVESGYARLPPNWQTQTAAIAHDTLMMAMRGMLTTLGIGGNDIFPPLPHFAAAMRARDRIAGLPGIALELPVSMMLLCRSIADIARASGEHTDDLRTRLACFELFALGDTRANNAADYYAARATLTAPTEDAVDYLSNTLMVDDESPVLHGYIASIATRFCKQIDIHTAAVAIPTIAAHNGVVINLLLIDHFLDIARSHFTVRRLERIYGQHEVQATYARIRPPAR